MYLRFPGTNFPKICFGAVVVDISFGMTIGNSE